jgi:hypothetical protein
MQHAESSIKIYFTKEYSLFKTIEGNRQLNAPKIKRILKDISNGIDLLRYCPILVIERNGRLEIIDGQHRFYVARKIGSKVWYIIAEEISLYDIARMNSNTEKWKAKDYINCYSQLGNKDYDVLDDFTAKFPIPISTAICMLQNGRVSTGGGDKESFEQGKFKINHLGYSNDLIEICRKFSFENKFSRSFLRAIDKVYQGKKINISDLIERSNKDVAAFKYIETEKQYLQVLEELFNKGKHSRTVIY